MDDTITQLSSAGISDPMTGEVLDTKDVDAMAEAYDRAERLRDQIDSMMKSIRVAIGELSEGETKTRRVRGARHTIRVEMPSPNWNQSILKRAWETWPELSHEYLRIEKLGPKAREVMKMRNTSGPEVFETFKREVIRAEEPSTAPPRIKIESATSRELTEQEERLTGSLVASLKRGA